MTPPPAGTAGVPWETGAWASEKCTGLTHDPPPQNQDQNEVKEMATKTKKTRVRAEKNRLEKLYADLPENKKRLAAGLIERAAFMRVELEDLEAFLAENGWTELFSQGKQEPYDRARPQGQTYNTMNGNYQKIIKQLDALLPRDDAPKGDPDDGFDDFVFGRDEP